MSSVDNTPQAVEEQASPTQIALQSLLAQAQSSLGNDLLETFTKADDAWLRVSTSSFREAAQWAKDAGLSYFCFLGGLDWMPNPTLGGEKTFKIEGDVEAEESDETDSSSDDQSMTTGYAGGDSRFQVIVRLYDVDRHVGLNIKCDVPETNSVPSLTSVFAGADWHERETWEMFGISFDGHPGLRKLYLPGEFEGHPLRKDFPLLAREVKPWPGIVDVEPIPGAGAEEGESE